jgi:type II secretory pathway pseudopilin PulG
MRFTLARYLRGAHAERGTTLFELLLSVTIAGMAAVSSALTFPAITTSIAQGQARDAFTAALTRARSEATAAGARGVLQVDNTSGSLTFGLDARPWNIPPRADSVLFRIDLPRGVTLSQSTLLFDPRGDLIDEESLPTTTTVILALHGAAFGEALLSPTGGVRYRALSQ